MCTAAGYRTRDFYFGRNLDYEFSYGEKIVITPRNFPLQMRNVPHIEKHLAIMGMAHVAEGYPLYYDGINEAGLAMAGLNFVGNAVYNETAEGKRNIAQFEFIPYILGNCKSVDEAKNLLGDINITNQQFSEKYPCSQLHWIISDKDGCIVVESTESGLHVYDNPTGVLTNNPPFPQQMFMLNNYAMLSPKQPVSTFAKGLELKQYSRGMGAIGLPGDLSSQSRFVRAAFTAMNSVSGDSERESVNQFFHILGSVEQQRGCCEVAGGKYEITIYTSCCNCTRGIYYYKTYENSAVNGVDMRRENLDGRELVSYPLITEQEFVVQNGGRV